MTLELNVSEIVSERYAQNFTSYIYNIHGLKTHKLYTSKVHTLIGQA